MQQQQKQQSQVIVKLTQQRYCSSLAAEHCTELTSLQLPGHEEVW
jgi:hypothetical protein